MAFPKVVQGVVDRLMNNEPVVESSLPKDFPSDNCPSVIIKFINPQFPTFEFVNWQPGISLGTFERAGAMMVREAQRKQAQMLTSLKTDGSNGLTIPPEDA